MAYSISLSLLNPDRYLWGLLNHFFTTDVLLGLTAMSIFTVMTVISNTWAMEKLGVTTWRRILRLGYLAYALLIIRAVTIEGHIWQNWWQTLSTLPPPRLIFSLFASFVILLRISIFITQKSKQDI